MRLTTIARHEENLMTTSSLPSPPALNDTLTEPLRAGVEAARLVFGFRRLQREVPRGDGHPVLVLPSYGTSDGGTLPVRRFLREIGYATPRAALGRNVDRGDLRIRGMEDAARFRAAQVDRVTERAREIERETGEQPSLVGWSMGGLFALDMSQRIPDGVRSVVTLGSPFGDPRGTSLFNLMRTINRSPTPVEEQDFGPWLARTQLGSDRVPITVIHSDRDGIVGRDIARLPRSRCVRHVRVESSHLGFAAHPEVFEQVARALARSGRSRHRLKRSA